MLHRPSPSALAATIAAASLAVYAASSSSGLWATAPWPFIWPDVALLYWLCLLPLLASLVSAVRHGVRSQAAPLVVSLLVLLALPAFYIHVRVAGQAQRARDYLEQSRFGEAQDLLSQILAIRPAATWQGVNLRQASEKLTGILEPIHTRVAVPLATSADPAQRLARARDLAMLGQAQESLDTLNAAPSLNDPDACVLRGAIFEAQQRWAPARDCYSRAASQVSSQNATPVAPSDSQLKALAGLGHCERKLGHLPAAEATYQALLATAPTAETHFLVAQFYEDTQQTTLAQAHARKAVELAPDQFRRPAEQLAAKLHSTHFGCLAAFATRSVPPSGMVRSP